MSPDENTEKSQFFSHRNLIQVVSKLKNLTSIGTTVSQQDQQCNTSSFSCSPTSQLKRDVSQLFPGPSAIAGISWLLLPLVLYLLVAALDPPDLCASGQGQQDLCYQQPHFPSFPTTSINKAPIFSFPFQSRDPDQRPMKFVALEGQKTFLCSVFRENTCCIGKG